MVFSFIIITLVLAVAIDAFVQHRKRRVSVSSAAVTAGVTPRLPGMAPELRAAVLDELGRTRRDTAVALHPGHAWARETADDIVTIGADELTGRLLGTVDGVQLPKVGDRLVQGRTAWRLEHDKRSVQQASPVTGKVVAVNTEVAANPEMVNRAPYEGGWLVKVAPVAWWRDRENLFSGSLAREWLALSKARIAAVFAPLMSEGYATAQDGGELVEGLGDEMTDEQWNRIHGELFLRSGSRQR